MKKNEEKLQEAAVAAGEEQQKTAAEEQQTPVAEEQQATVDGGPAVISEPAPKDGDGMEAVTVLVCVDFNDVEAMERVEYIKRSVAKNLQGVNGEIIAINVKNREQDLAEVLKSALPDIETDRIILMNDRTALLRPVTLSHVAIPKAKIVLVDEVGGGTMCDYDTGLPMMIRKSAMLAVLEHYTGGSLLNVYADMCLKDVQPITVLQNGDNVGFWREDELTLPVVTKNPQISILKRWINRPFLLVKSEHYPQSVLDLLKELFPDEKKK